MKRLDQMEHLVKILGEKETLDALVRAMSDAEMEENYRYILQMYDIEEDLSHETI